MLWHLGVNFNVCLINEFQLIGYGIATRGLGGLGIRVHYVKLVIPTSIH